MTPWAMLSRPVVILSTIPAVLNVYAGSLNSITTCSGVPGACRHLNLFTNDTNISWDGARAMCEEMGQRLVSISDRNLNHNIQMLIYNRSEVDKAWIGGVRELNTSWFSLDREKYDGGVDDTGGGNCGALYIRVNNVTVMSENCENTSSNRSVICHTNLTEDLCNSTLDIIWTNRTCLLVTAPNRTSWYDAQNMCRHLFAEHAGRLIDHTADWDSLTGVLPAGPQDGKAWLGIWRHPWYWQHNHEMMTYFNWADTSGDPLEENTTVQCTAITRSGKWIQEPCDKPVAQHFICVDEDGSLDVSFNATDVTQEPLHSQQTMARMSRMFVYLSIVTGTLIISGLVAGISQEINRYKSSAAASKDENIMTEENLSPGDYETIQEVTSLDVSHETAIITQGQVSPGEGTDGELSSSERDRNELDRNDEAFWDDSPHGQASVSIFRTSPYTEVCVVEGEEVNPSIHLYENDSNQSETPVRHTTYQLADKPGIQSGSFIHHSDNTRLSRDNNHGPPDAVSNIGTETSDSSAPPTSPAPHGEHTYAVVKKKRLQDPANEDIMVDDVLYSTYTSEASDNI